MKSATYVLSLLAAGTALGASTIVFDDFDTFSSPIGWSLSSTGAADADGPELVPSSDETLPGTLTRDVLAVRTSPGGSLSTDNASGYLVFQTSSSGIGTVGLNYYLSTPADLTVGNAFSFVLVSTDLTAQINYSITVNDGVNTSTRTSVLPIVLGVFNVPFSSFVGSADFTGIESVHLQLTSIVAGSDADIDAFGINLPPPPEVPESSTYAAVGFMSIVAFGAYRRNRR